MYNQGYRPPNQGNRPPNQGNWYAPPPNAAQNVNYAQRPAPTPRRSVPPKKKSTIKSVLIKISIVLVLLAAATAGLYVWKIQNDVRPYTSVFVDNVSVDGIELSGKSWEQGSAEVWALAAERQNSWYVRLRNGSGQYKDITAQALGISFDPSAALYEAWGVGRVTDAEGRIDVFKTHDAIESAKTEKHEFFSVRQDGDFSAIDGILQTLANAAYKAPSDARILSFNPDDTKNPFTFQSEVYGQWLDTTAIREQIYNCAQTLQVGEILIEPTPIAPTVTVADLQKTVALRFRATTPISKDSTEGRTNNIRIAFGKINGMILKDGGKFSFNGTVGRRNQENGFFEAIEYAYGQEKMGWGGGVCQASTTVYLAAVQSGLTISKREAHSKPVSYTDMGKDATVSDTRGREVDFVFRNNSGAPIYITAHVIQSGKSSKSLLCEVCIYGQSLENTRYELESVTVETIPKPVDPILVDDKEGLYVLYNDEKKLMSKGHDGYKVETYLCTITDNVQVERKLMGTDVYPEAADRYWVGVNMRGF